MQSTRSSIHKWDRDLFRGMRRRIDAATEGLKQLKLSTSVDAVLAKEKELRDELNSLLEKEEFVFGDRGGECWDLSNRKILHNEIHDNNHTHKR